MESKTITFTQGGTFEALEAAKAWLTENGYSYGSSQRDGPTAIKKGDCAISKWRNLSAGDRAVMDGTMDGDFRNGPVTIRIKASATGGQYGH